MDAAHTTESEMAATTQEQVIEAVETGPRSDFYVARPVAHARGIYLYTPRGHELVEFPEASVRVLIAAAGTLNRRRRARRVHMAAERRA